jgi:phytol kinase
MNDESGPFRVICCVTGVFVLGLCIMSFGNGYTEGAKKGIAFCVSFPGVGDAVTTFFENALPDMETIIKVGPPLLVTVGAASAFVSWLKIKKVKTPYTRKVFHFIVFTTAGFLQIRIGLPAVVILGFIVAGAIVVAVYRGTRLYEALARPTDAPHRTLFVLLPLFMTVIGGGVSNFVFGQAAAIGYLVSGWGDAVGEPVGTKWGVHRYRVFSLASVSATRSLEGSLAVFVVGSAAACCGLYGLGAGISALWIGVTAGAVGAVVEAFSTHGIDNLTVQIAVSAVVFLM